jgi:cobaltochelatase CobN
MHYLGQLPDLPLPHTGQRLRSRRKPLAQIVLCQGCCCGQTERGLPAVPLDWLKPIWKSEKLNKVVQLTVSGCLGPCDLPNVCCIVTPQEQAWYGRLTTQEDYAVLLNWARQCRESGAVLPFPAELAHLRFERWCGDEDVNTFTPIDQEPADIVLLSAADTDLLTWSAALSALPKDFPSVRALNLDRLRERRVFDAYLDDVLQESRIVLVRVLGGLSYWREQLEAIHVLARAHGIPLVCLPGDAVPDPDLARLCTVPLPLADTVWRYCLEGGTANAAAMLQHLSDKLLGTALAPPAPAPLPESGIYDPGSAEVLDFQAWRRRYWKPGRPTVGIAFYRAHWVTGNLAPVQALGDALAARELNVLPVFGPDLASILQSRLLPAGSIDLLLTTTSFSATFAAGPRDSGQDESRSSLTELDVPVLQAICCSSSENVWAANVAGLAPRDVAMNIALPEFDGRIITTAVSFKNTLAHDAGLQTDIVRYQPRADRIGRVAGLAKNWARLRHTPNGEKRVVILLANYPSKNARVGNAVGLDTPASLQSLLLALRNAGYDTGPTLPADGQGLIEALIAASIHDGEFASEAAHTDPAGWVTAEQYRAWLSEFVAESRKAIVDQWGDADGSPQFHDDGFPIAGLRLGNIFVGIQPARGYDQDASAVYHSPDLPPPPHYVAFYRWIRETFSTHAVIHLGKHGNLEWLPGKSAALSAGCFPEAVLGDLPNIYPYIINNPGEGTQAKRRTAAVIVDHLIPPMTRADTYGELRQLEGLLDEYHTVQSLDPAKAPLVLEQVAELIRQTNLHRDLDLEEAPVPDRLSEVLNRIDGYLCEIKEAQIRDGLHVLGRLPEGEQLIDLLFSLVRIDNGSVPSLPRALAGDLALDYAALTVEPSATAPSSICNLQLLGTCRTCGDVIEALALLCRRLIDDCLRKNSIAGARSWLAENCKLQIANCKLQIEDTLGFLWRVVWPRLQLCHQEIDHVLRALDGRFVPPGPSGAPTRGTADILPTGRNFYSLDIRAVPTPTAWRVGSAAATSLVERHRQRTGNYPESVAFVIWGTSNMRTGGDDIACVLALFGVRPCWDAANRRVVGLEAIPLTELGRPRIDVTMRISGLFRDAFPNLVRLLNEAVALAARLEEPLDRNFLRANIARDTALLCRGSKIEDGGSRIENRGGPLSIEEASRVASLRVFGSKPGAYGAGLLPLIDGRNWESDGDLAEVYSAWSSYAYTGAENDGRQEQQAFQLRLARTEVVTQNQDNREHDIFDSDDYFQFHGGMIAAIRSVTGKTPQAYLGDTSQPDQVRTRTLREEACRVFRSRVVNPRWLAGVMRHGYKGAVEMAATVDYLFGYDATAEILDDWMYERLAEAYLFDEKVGEFLRRANPWAERAMIERLLEAAERGLWENPSPEMLARLQSQHGGNEAWLEGWSAPIVQGEASQSGRA